MKTRDAFTAIADPTRREILDLLRARRIATAGEVAEAFAQVSRPAISRHLRVLKECGVVSAHKSGKLVNYVLNPTPLNEIRLGWLAGFADPTTQSLGKLRDKVERR